jgi:hypothetical protein
LSITIRSTGPSRGGTGRGATACQIAKAMATMAATSVSMGLLHVAEGAMEAFHRPGDRGAGGRKVEAHEALAPGAEAGARIGGDARVAGEAARQFLGDMPRPRKSTQAR